MQHVHAHVEKSLKDEGQPPVAGRDRMRDTDAGDLFRRDGEYWTIVYEGRTCRLRHSRGLYYLAQLLRVPGSEIHALDLEAPARGRSSAPEGAFAHTCRIGREGDAGTVIDPRARMDYRRRLREIEAELAAAEADNDPGRAERLRAEHEALERELRRAVDFRGRLRRAVPASERARLNVTRAIRKAIVRIDASHPPLGQHLMRRVRTGTFCAYHADPHLPRSWTVAT